MNPREATRDRRIEVVRLVRSGINRVEALAERLSTSTSTIRRDLSALERTGQLARTYGGATSLAPYQERALAERMSMNTRAKAAIGSVAASLVPPGATIFVDAGSTTAHLIDNLRGSSGLTVVTRGLEIALSLAEEDGIDVIVVGGHLSRNSHGTAGALASDVLRRFTFDVSFLGADAVDPRDGVGEPTVEEALTKEQVAQRSSRTAVLADSSKLQARQVPAWATLPTGWTLITDARDKKIVKAFENAGVSVTSVTSQRS